MLSASERYTVIKFSYRNLCNVSGDSISSIPHIRMAAMFMMFMGGNYKLSR